jgi:hypothetical protein
MVSQKSVMKQLKKLNFNPTGWGRGEVLELHHILLPDEQIYELVNGMYENGFALLVATDIRVLLIDKKPLNYLTVEDLRFDMINEIDYSHRLMGAQISITTGSRNLRFRSYNQQRLRKLIGHVQDCMAESKRRQSTHQEGQVQHLEKINQQLQEYLIAQQQYQQQVHQMQQAGKSAEQTMPEPVKPNPELSDFLYAQSLMAQYQQAQTQLPPAAKPEPKPVQAHVEPTKPQPPTNREMQDLYAEGMKEIYGKHSPTPVAETTPEPSQATFPASPASATVHHRPLEINPISIAYSKLPMALRNRKFGRPLFHAQSALEGRNSDALKALKEATAPKAPAESELIYSR